jgi:Fe-S-cluster containining protein
MSSETISKEIGGLSRKEALWLSCARKSCCQSGLVIPTGRDIWRLARALGVSPDSYLMCFETPVPRRDAFALDRSGRRFRLALAKRPDPKHRDRASCIFLLRTRQGHHRCGVCSIRPGVCRAFPSNLPEGVLCVGSDDCACRTWSLADVDIAEERALVEARQRDAEEYCDLVARWNDRVETTPGEATLEVGEFCNFLLAAYDGLAEQSEAMT